MSLGGPITPDYIKRFAAVEALYEKLEPLVLEAGLPDFVSIDGVNPDPKIKDKDGSIACWVDFRVSSEAGKAALEDWLAQQGVEEGQTNVTIV